MQQRCLIGSVLGGNSIRKEEDGGETVRVEVENKSDEIKRLITRVVAAKTGTTRIGIGIALAGAIMVLLSIFSFWDEKKYQPTATLFFGFSAIFYYWYKYESSFQALSAHSQTVKKTKDHLMLFSNKLSEAGVKCLNSTVTEPVSADAADEESGIGDADTKPAGGAGADDGALEEAGRTRSSSVVNY